MERFLFKQNSLTGLSTIWNCPAPTFGILERISKAP